MQYKAFEYLFLVASEDEETQKKGVIGIHWIKGESVPIPDRREPTSKQCLLFTCYCFLLFCTNIRCCCFGTGSKRFFEAIPVRLTSIHQCLDKSPLTQIIRSLTALMMKSDIRLQLHLENTWEVRYRLMSYGIPVDCKCMQERVSRLVCCMFLDTH